MPALAQAQGTVCDVDVDGDIDQLDITAIFAARNTPASGPGDPRDSIPDGIITVNDAAVCMSRCTIAGCPVITPDVNTPPVADAGEDQTVSVGDTVILDGSGSSDADGDMLTFAWSFLAIPPGSTAVLSDATAVMPAFTADVAGDYVVQLVVNDAEANSAPDEVVIVTVPGNSAPVADAGPDQTVLLGATVELDGSGSSDVDGDFLSYFWTIANAPIGSTAVLSDATAVNPTFVADLPGEYVVELVVDDGLQASFPDVVVISTANIPPVANAGPDQTVDLAALVQLDGNGSSDADGDPLSFSWSFVSLPAGSTAALGNATTATPTFVADVAGTYVVQLIVNDGQADSGPDTVVVTTSNTRPVADAGVDQVVSEGDTVQLDGSGSFDADGDALSYSWSFATAPTGSSAALSDPSAVDPSFEADIAGLFVVQLIVNDGELASAPDTATITVEVVENTAPEAADDTATTDEDVAIDIDVLANDSDADGDTLEITNVTQPQNGVSELAGALIRYTPATDFNGVDTFTYTISDGTDADTATVTVTVNAVNDAPIAVDDTAATQEGVFVDIDVLANDTDVDGDTLTVANVTAPANGTAEASGGGVRYTPDAGFSGTDIFTYTADDGNGGTDTATVTVTVSALPVVSITATDPDAAEEGLDPGEFTLARTGDTTAELSVTLTIGGSATNGTDYQALTTGFTIPAGSASTTLTVTPIDDAANEGTESVVVTIAAGAGYEIGTPDTATVTIADDDLPVVTVEATDPSASEAGPDTGTFTITRSGDTSDALIVSLSIGGSATDATDYANILPSILLNAGEASGTITITPLPDNIVEGEETVIVTIAPGSEYTVGTPDSATVTIADDAATVTLEVLDAAAAEAGPDNGSFRITRSGGNPAAALIVDYTVTGSAGNGVDFVTIGSSATVPANQASVTVTITPVADNLVEGTETAVVTLAADAAYSIGTPNSATIEIADDPAVITVVATDPDATETGPDTGTFTFTRAGGDLGEALIVTTTIGGTATELADYSNIQPTLLFAAGSATQTITITPIADALVEGDETVILTISGGGSQYEIGTPGTATVTIADGTATIDLTPDPLNLLTLASGTMTVTSSQPAGPGGRLVALSSSDTGIATVPPSVTMPEGAQQASFTVTSGAEGSATITATSSGVADASATVNVSNRSLSIALSSPLVGSARTIDGTVTLSQPAPAGGVTIDLNSGDDGIATVNPASVTFPEGSTSGAFTVTGVALGATSIEASGAGFDPASATVTVTSQVIQIGAVPTIGPEQSASLPISLSTPAVGDVLVTLVSADPTIATVTNSVVIPDGQQIPTANPQVTGAALGTTSVTATATGFAPETRDVTVALTLTFQPLPDPFALFTGATENITLNLSAPAPSGGLDVNLTIDDDGIASVPTNVTIPAGQTLVLVPVTGITPGTTTLRASSPGIAEASKSVQVEMLGDVIFNATSERVGDELQTSALVRLETAPPSPVDLTLSVPPGSGVTLSTVATAEGSETITIPNVSTATFQTVWIQGRAIGATVITASAPGYADDTLPVSVDPAGFAFQSVTDPATVDVFSPNVSYTISGLRLDPTTLNWAEQQRVRGGAVFDIPVLSSDPTIGVFVTSPVTIGANQSSTQAGFDPLQPGSTVLSLQQPPGFQALANPNNTFRTQFTQEVVGSAVLFNVASDRVGDELQTSVLVRLESAPPSPVDLTLSVPPGSGVTLSTVSTVEGSETITIPNVSTASSQTVWIQGRAIGATVINASAPGYSDATLPVSVDPAGVAFQSVTDPATVDVFSPNVSYTISGLRLDPTTLNWAEQQRVRGGASIDIPVLSSDSAVGVFATSPVTITAGAFSTTASFDPLQPGSTVLSLQQPPGFQALANPGNTFRTQFTQEVVGSAVLFNRASERVGDELQTSVLVRLESAPPSPVDLTLSVPPGSGVTLSTVSTVEGSETITIPNVSTASSQTVWIQGRAIGATVINASAPGYSDVTLPVSVDPAGVAFQSVTDPESVDVFSANVSYTVAALRLDPTTFNWAEQQRVRGGASIDVPVLSSDSAVGVFATSPVTITAGAFSTTASFDPLQVGSTVLSVQQPPGFQALANPSTTFRTQFTQDVVGSAVLFNLASDRVGDELQTSVSVRLESAPPSPVDLTLSVPPGSGVTLSTVSTAEGSETITIPNVSTSANQTVWIQGRAIGATVITASAPGYSDDTLPVSVDPAGFAFQSITDPETVDVFSPNLNYTVAALRLDPTTLNWAEQQGVRGGASIDVPVLSSDPSVGAFATSPVTITGSQFNVPASFDPLQSGSTVLSLQQPPGFQVLANPGTTFRTQFTVNVTGLPIGGGANLSLLPGVVASASSDFGTGWTADLAIDGVNTSGSSWCTANNDPAPRLTLVFPDDITVQSFTIVTSWSPGFDFLTGRFVMFDAADAQVGDSGIVALSGGEISMLLGTPVTGVRRVDFLGVSWNSIEPCLSELAVGGFVE